LNAIGQAIAALYVAPIEIRFGAEKQFVRAKEVVAKRASAQETGRRLMARSRDLGGDRISWASIGKIFLLVVGEFPKAVAGIGSDIEAGSIGCMTQYRRGNASHGNSGKHNLSKHENSPEIKTNT
jgi:hypothetical protein